MRVCKCCWSLCLTCNIIGAVDTNFRGWCCWSVCGPFTEPALPQSELAMAPTDRTSQPTPIENAVEKTAEGQEDVPGELKMDCSNFFRILYGGEFVIIWWWAQHRGVAITHRSAIHASKHVWRTTTSTKQQLRSI